MMAGHAVIKVFAGFAGALGLGAIAPIFAITAVYGLENARCSNTGVCVYYINLCLFE